MDGRHGRRSAGRRLFGTTKGKMLAMLCGSPRTVGELAAHVGLTRNAVRAQLKRLQRDGLVRAAGLRPGVSKPHVDYELTAKAHQLFPRAYEPVLRKLVDRLTGQLAAGPLRALFVGVADGLLREHVGTVRARDSRRRLSEITGKLGGAAVGIELEQRGAATLVRACACPVASVTAAHPDVCALFAAALTDVLGAPVRAECDRGAAPRCCFRVSH